MQVPRVPRRNRIVRQPRHTAWLSLLQSKHDVGDLRLPIQATDRFSFSEERVLCIPLLIGVLAWKKRVEIFGANWQPCNAVTWLRITHGDYNVSAVLSTSSPNPYFRVSTPTLVYSSNTCIKRRNDEPDKTIMLKREQFKRSGIAGIVDTKRNSVQKISFGEKRV